MANRARPLTFLVGVLVSATLAASTFGCGTKTILVAIPPRIDLRPHDPIGVVDFVAEPADALQKIATQRFMSVVQESQPGLGFLELGPVAPLLEQAGRRQLDPDAVKVIGRRYNVGTIFTGGYQVSSLSPQLVLGQDLSSVSASARVKITLTVRQWDTKTGATLWTRSRFGEWSVARMSKGIGQPVLVSVNDPASKYGDYLAQLINAVTDDFRVHYERRPVEKH